MLHILIILLKLIGIVLGSLLGLLLLMILLVLFVPIRYQVDANKQEEITASVRVSWLIRILYFRLEYINDKMKYKVRVFGFVFVDSEKQKSARQKTKKRRRAKKSKARQDIQEESKQSLEDVIIQRDDVREDADISLVEITTEHDQDAQKMEHQLPKNKGIYQKVKDVFKSVYRIIREVCMKLKAMTLQVKENAHKIIEIINNVHNKVKKIKAFLQNKVNQQGLKEFGKGVKKIIKHCLPTKWNASIYFGTGDPCSTGQALGAISIAYSFIGEHLQVRPNFEEAVFEGTLYAKGRIRLFTVLLIGIKLYFNQYFQELLKNTNSLKEEF